MKTLKVEILNPKAIKLLRNLAELNLITIKETPSTGFQQAIAKVRSKVKNPPSFEEITAEVELVRSKKYEK